MLCVTFSAIPFMAFLSFMIVQVKEAECEDEELHCICRKLTGKCVGIALCDTGKMNANVTFKINFNCTVKIDSNPTFKINASYTFKINSSLTFKIYFHHTLKINSNHTLWINSYQATEINSSWISKQITIVYLKLIPTHFKLIPDYQTLVKHLIPPFVPKLI